MEEVAVGTQLQCVFEVKRSRVTEPVPEGGSVQRETLRVHRVGVEFFHPQRGRE